MRSGPSTLAQEEETKEQAETRVKAVIAALNFDRGAVRLADADLVIALDNAEKTLTEISDIPEFTDYAMQLAEQLGIYYGYHPRDQKRASEKLKLFKEAAIRKLGITPDALEYARACMYLEHAKTNEQDKEYYDQALITVTAYEKTLAGDKYQVTRSRSEAINNIPGLLEYAHACMYTGYVGTIQGSYHDERLFVEALAIFNNYQKQLAAKNALTSEKISQLNIEKGYIECFLGLQIHRKSYLVGKNESQRIDFLKNAVQHLVAGQQLQRAALDIIGPVNDQNRDLYLQVTIELANTYHIQGVVSGKMFDHGAELTAYEGAMELEKAYEVATDRKHFLTFVTLQNYSLTLANNFNRAKDALSLLQQTLQDQQEYYKDKQTGKYVDNFDIAKTYHFTGMVLVKLGRHAEAVNYFQQSYDMKIRLGSSRIAPEVLDSQNCLLTAHSEAMLQTVTLIDLFNWTDFKTIKPFESCVEALASMTDHLSVTLVKKDYSRIQQLLPTLYQLGAYYVHVPRNPILANLYLAPALKYCEANSEIVNKDLHAWILNHSAFTNQQSLAQCYGKPIEKLRKEYAQYNPHNTNPALTEQEIRDIYYKDAVSQAKKVLQYQAPDLLTKNQLHGFANLIIAYADYERQRVMSDRDEKRKIMAGVIQQVADALKLYEDVKDLGEQYLRAKNRYADLISEYVLLLDNDAEKAALPDPLKIYEEIEEERKLQKTNKANPWAGRFYFSFGKYLEKKLFISDVNHANYPSETNMNYLERAVVMYGQAHTILSESVIDGPRNKFTLEVGEIKAGLEKRLADLNNSPKNRSQVLATGSTTADAGMYAGSERKSQENKLAEAAALAAAQQPSAQSTSLTKQ
ncbi:MAG: hypothetical protein V4501_03235 [Pseudomonadota bacterium]